MVVDRKDLNEYLYFEFGIDGHESAISESWPYELTFVGRVDQDAASVIVYTFDDKNERFYAVSPDHDYYPVAGMSFDDLRLQMEGSAWIEKCAPIDLNTIILGDETIPKTRDRQDVIKTLAEQKLGMQSEHKILEGLYLKTEGIYLALIELDPAQALLIGTGMETSRIAFPEASPWRRLSYGIGKELSKKE
jgi:hypothetical protein